MMRTCLYLFLLAALPAVAVESHIELAPAELAARTVAYGDRDVVPVHARLRYTTLIVLPKEEQVLDYVCGDKEYWVVDGAQNFAYVKPAKKNARSNLNLITAAGNIYSFALEESDTVTPDVKLFIEPREDSSLRSALRAGPRFLPIADLKMYQARAESAEKEAAGARRQAEEAARNAEEKIERDSAKLAASYPGKMQFPYRFAAHQSPFEVDAMYHDGKFTYIRATPEEPPALYEIKDGKPSLVEFQFRDGMYVVPKILDSGYLAIGKRKLNFYRSRP